MPGGVLPLQIFEPRYLNMIDDAMAGDRLIGMIQTGGGGDRRLPDLAKVGCAGRVTSYAETGDGKYLISLTGVCRFSAVEELQLRRPYRMVRAHFEPFATDLVEGEEATEFERPAFLEVLRRYLDNRGSALNGTWSPPRPAPPSSTASPWRCRFPATRNRRCWRLAAWMSAGPFWLR